MAYPYEYASAVVWNPFAQNPFSSGAVSVGYPGGGISAVLNVPPGIRQNILVPVQSNYGGPFRITATQGVGVDSVELAYQIVQGEGSYLLDFTPTAGNVRLNIIRVMGYNDGVTASVTLLAPRRSILGYNQQNQLVQICPTPEDQYRFGFNGQQKDNEYAGLGNHTSALFWEYDPRVAMRWNVDPVESIGISRRAVFNGNPISLNDPQGDCPTCLVGAGVALGKMLFSFGGQVLSATMQGKSLGEAVRGVDYADVALSGAEGFIDGLTLGGSTLATKAMFGALRAGVDYKPGEDGWKGVKVMGIEGEHGKDPKAFVKDLAVEAVELGVGKIFDKAIGVTSPFRAKALYKARMLESTFGSEAFGNMFQVPTDAGLSKLLDMDKDSQSKNASDANDQSATHTESKNGAIYITLPPVILRPNDPGYNNEQVNQLNK